MTNWLEYWNGHPRITESDEFLRQVGKTVSGEVIPESHVDAIVADIVGGLDLRADDRVLDLCCGNGLITRRCARHCRSIVGIDFSRPLIAVAREHFAADAIEYVEGDVCSLLAALRDEPFSKIYMYEALQHLADDQAQTVLSGLRESKSRTAPILFGSVPDRDRRWDFYDTPERREQYERAVAEGTEPIGHWWTKRELIALGERHGYAVEIRELNEVLHGARYRFHALLRPISERSRRAAPSVG